MQISASASAGRQRGAAVAVPVAVSGAEEFGALVSTPWSTPPGAEAEIDGFLRDVGHRGSAGAVHPLPRPTREPAHLLFFGIGDRGGKAWREAGAAVARAAERLP